MPFNLMEVFFFSHFPSFFVSSMSGLGTGFEAELHFCSSLRNS